MNNPRSNQSLEPRRVQVQPAWTPQDAVREYDPYWTNAQYVPPQYITIEPETPPQTALAPLDSFARTLQNVFQMQMAMLQDMDRRMSRLEQKQPAQRPHSADNIYAQTWWALWGILMLILGAALIVVVLLIFRG